MGYERTHLFQQKSSHTPQPTSQFSSRPFEAPVQRKPKEQMTPDELENEAFNQNKFEAFGLQLKEKNGTITPVEQERLGVLQAKMDDFWAQREERATRFGYDFSKVSVTPREARTPQLQPWWLQRKDGVAREEDTEAMNSPQQLPAFPIQAKWTIGEPGDKYEQEADAVAARVVEQIHAPATAQSPQGQSVQRQAEEETEEVRAKPEISALQRMDEPNEEEIQGKFIQKAGEAKAGGEATTDLESAINSARGGGQPLDVGLQQSMGQAMEADFSGVRVHTDAQADELNQSIQAKAFTTGQDVFFRQGVYEPGSRGGQELIAHELTHVVQQKKHQSVPTPIQRIIDPYVSPTLGTKCNVMKGLNDQQMANIQLLHDAQNHYTINDARKMVGAPPLPEPDTPKRPPLAHRYDARGGKTMETVTSGMGGLVCTPVGGAPQAKDTNNQMAFAVDLGREELPPAEKRARSQIQVMGISPNEAAERLGLERPQNKSWEWLHLVAFSISETHVRILSPESREWIERSDQRQQIRENLVLGTAAANTEMLTWETHIKELLKQHKGWKLHLAAMARKEDRQHGGIRIPVATRISYHFYFETEPKTYTPPVIVEFDTRSHHKPATKSFDEARNVLYDTMQNQVTLKEPLKGISTIEMVDISKRKNITK